MTVYISNSSSDWTLKTRFTPYLSIRIFTNVYISAYKIFMKKIVVI
jgi:hypothetical protein